MQSFAPLPLAPIGFCSGKWVCSVPIGVLIVALALVAGAGVSGIVTGLVVYDLATCTTGGTHVPRDPGAVVIPAYPDTGCAYPYRGVAGVLEPVDEGRVLYISNCHKLYLLHTVDLAAATVASTSIPSNLPSVTTPTDTLKFAAYDRAVNKLYVSFLRHLSGGCVSLSIVVCAFDAAPLGDAPSVACATLYDSERVDPACGSMNTHATGGQLMSTGTELLFTVGDLLQKPSQAQDDASFWGKIWRAPLGKEPLERADFTMVSKGHRNPQGLCPIATDDGAHLVLETEHGPRGGDEINVLDLNASPPANYGWPVVSYGDHYDGTVIPDTHAPVYTEPVAFFAYNLVGSHGLTVCTSWNGYYVIGSLNGHKLYALVLDDDHKVGRLSAVDIGYRIRSIARLDDCAALLLTEPDDETQGPLIRVNMCGLNQLYADPDRVST